MVRTPQRPLAAIFPTLFSLAALVVILFVALGGVGGKLTEIYYLKTDLSNLGVPSKLQDSTFLQDISKVSGVDYVGESSTAASLGLASSYTIGLLVSCGHFPDGAVACTKPALGYSYRPIVDLRLDSTALEGTYSAEFMSVMWTYGKVNRFMVYAYLFAAVLSLLAPLIALCSAALGGALSAIGTVLLAAASIAAVVVFRNVNRAFNTSFETQGMTSSLGNIPIALSFVAFGLSLVATILLLRRACDPTGTRRGAGRKRVVARSVGGKDGEGLLGGSGGAAAVGSGSDINEKKPGLWGRIPTFSQHKYVQVEHQPALVRTDVSGRQEAVQFSSPDMRPQQPADNGGSGFPSLSISGNKPTKDLNTAYEPYSSSTK